MLCRASSCRLKVFLKPITKGEILVYLLRFIKMGEASFFRVSELASPDAAEAGVRSQMFGVFHDAGYLGQYTLDAENIRIYKGIPEGGEILDYMGREELAANLFRITQTEGRLRRERVVGEDAAIQAHYRVGREVRDTLKRLGATMPEDLPTAESIRGELERQRRARQKIQRQQQKDQDTLF